VVISYNPVYKGSSRSVVYATKTSALSLPNNATTGITGWTAGLDTNSNFDVTTGTFTAPAAGNYLVSAQVCSAYGSVAAGAIFALLVLANSATVAAGESGFTTAGTTDMCAQTTVLASLAAGQTITVSVYHTSGAAINTASGAGKNYLSITQLP
jgi:hypothetical protein